MDAFTGVKSFLQEWGFEDLIPVFVGKFVNWTRPKYISNLSSLRANVSVVFNVWHIASSWLLCGALCILLWSNRLSSSFWVGTNIRGMGPGLRYNPGIKGGHKLFYSQNFQWAKFLRLFSRRNLENKSVNRGPVSGQLVPKSTMIMRRGPYIVMVGFILLANSLMRGPMVQYELN